MRAGKRNLTTLIITALFVVVVFILSFFGGGAVTARAAVSASYTDVLEDLQKDTSFNAAHFPAVKDDYSLSVIQIAESADGELFVYVYQPSAETKQLIATSINVSTAINESLSYHNYKLELLSCEGMFGKYLVKDFAVKPDAVRYYDISSIYRAWDKTIDEGLKPTNENNISEVAFGVEKQYTACTVAGNVSYNCIEPEYITVTDKYVGYLRYGWDDMPAFLKIYTAGMFDIQSMVDSWVVAFSTDLPMDRLMEADVYYVQQDVYFAAMGIVGFATPKTTKYAHLNYKQKKQVEAGLYHKNTYTWDRIQSVKDFIKSEKLTEEGAADIADKQWILRFTETEYKNAYTMVESASYMASGSRISDVTILRLKFETDGKVYNLGVVDNKQSPAPGQAPDNQYKPDPEKPEESIWDKIVKFFKTVWAAIKKFISFKLPWWVYLIFFGVIFGILIPILCLIFPPIWRVFKLILKVLWNGIKYLFKAICWLISAPFRFIAWLVKKCKKNGAPSKAKTSKSK